MAKRIELSSSKSVCAKLCTAKVSLAEGARAVPRCIRTSVKAVGLGGENVEATFEAGCSLTEPAKAGQSILPRYEA
jgi:hypothetical protein